MKIEVTGNTIIYRHEPKTPNDKARYSTKFSKKLMNGEWLNAWLYVNFRKGVEVENKTKVRINSGWLDFYVSVNRDTNKPSDVYGIFINEFDNLGSAEPAYNEPQEDSFAEAEDEIPF